MKWIKANERMPVFEQQVFIKDNVGCKRLGNFFENDFGVETLYICANGAHEPFYIQAKDFWSIEWLDESETPSTDETKKLREALEKAQALCIAWVATHTIEGVKPHPQHAALLTEIEEALK